MSKSSTDLRGAGGAGATTISFRPLGVPFRGVADGVRIAVRLTPKAAQNRIRGLVADADGSLALKVAVTAAPERGKANDALIGFLAERWGVAKRDLSLVAGAADRHKMLHLAGEPAALLRRLAAWLDRAGLAGDTLRG